MMHEIDDHLWIQTLAQRICWLSDHQLLLLSSFLKTHPTISMTSARLQRLLSLSTTEAVQLTRILNNTGTDSEVGQRDNTILATALYGISAGRSLKAENPQMIEIVCTDPARLGVPVRTTFATTLEMVATAREDIFLVGYVFTRGAQSLVRELATARKRGVRITIVGNRMYNHLPTFRAIWPAGIPPPTVHSRPADPNNEMAALHAKILICDATAALVTSANFTHHGLHENIEIGVRIESTSVARLVEFIRTMIAMEEVDLCEW